MFTGIVCDLAHVQSIRESTQHFMQLVLVTKQPFREGVKLGDSIAVCGCCLTVTAMDMKKQILHFDLSDETLNRTWFRQLKVHDVVHIEYSLRLVDGLDGHWVSGHVDTVGYISDINHQQQTMLMRITVPGEYEALIINKGSICVDGVSLTINEYHRKNHQLELSFYLIPETLKKTRFTQLTTGTGVNIEFDILGKYVVQALKVHPK